MFSSIYGWLWPLFESCSGEHALALNYTMPLHVTDQLGNTLYNSQGYPVPLTACICPTPLMNVLLVLAVIGILACLFSLVGSWIAVLRPSRRRPDPVLSSLVANLDRVSDDYLNQV